MAKVELIETPEPTSEESAMISQTVGSLLISVSFWMVLLLSASLYAAVALSPKLADWINVRQQYLSNAVRLKQLEDEADYLERVAAALKSDPEFAKRMVRANQNPGTEDSGFVPVSQDLLFGGAVQTPDAEPQVVRPAVATLVFHLASHEQHRIWLLMAATGLTLSAFTFLNDAGIGILRMLFRGVGKLITVTVGRYRLPEAASDDATAESASGPD